MLQMQAQQLAQLQSNVTARAHALNMAQMHGGTAAQQAQMHAEAQMQAQLQIQIQAQIRAQQQLQHGQHGAPPHLPGQGGINAGGVPPHYPPPPPNQFALQGYGDPSNPNAAPMGSSPPRMAYDGPGAMFPPPIPLPSMPAHPPMPQAQTQAQTPISAPFPGSEFGQAGSLPPPPPPQEEGGGSWNPASPPGSPPW